MLYFKNTELAERYHITLRTVLNWIQAAKEGKLDITLHTEKDKVYVANTARNVATLSRVVEERRKYRNLKTVKTIMPKSEFYDLYNEEQIYDIISNLEIHHEIPRQYDYFNGGAYHWDEYAQRLMDEEIPNTLNSTIKLLSINQDYIDDLLTPYKQVNVVDVGVGNAYPVRDFLAHLLKKGKLGRYIALDISPSMLEIARDNVKKWFDGKVAFEGHERDITHERFSNLLVKEHIKKNAKDTINLMLLFGGTLSNVRYPDAGFRVIHDSMGINDLLIHAKKLDSEHTRQYFDFSPTPGSSALAPIFGFVVDLLNIEPSYYDVVVGYDPQRRERYETIKLKVSLNIRFDFSSGERILELNKGVEILVWRAFQQTADDVRTELKRNDFYLLQSSQTEDQEYMLTVSRVKRD